MGDTKRTVAGWILEERLGVGGFGEVWKARRRHVDLVRALKLMPLSSERDFDGWRHEINRLEALSHPNIVQVYDADIVTEPGPYQDYAWIATELCEHSLKHELDSRPAGLLAPEEAVRLLDEMLAALAAAHADEAVHRDVKPANILLHRSGSWKICDFGTARLVGEGESHPRTTVVGTSPYMSAAAHRGRQDYAADLYALGVTVHEALCGKRLHERVKGMTDSEYVKLILETPPTVSPGLPPEWQTAIRALISADGKGARAAGKLRDWFKESRGAHGGPPSRNGQVGTSTVIDRPTRPTVRVPSQSAPSSSPPPQKAYVPAPPESHTPPPSPARPAQPAQRPVQSSPSYSYPPQPGWAYGSPGTQGWQPYPPSPSAGGVPASALGSLGIPGELWRRALAYVADGIIVALTVYLISRLVMAIMTLNAEQPVWTNSEVSVVALLVTILFIHVVQQGRWGVTFGKLMFGLRTVRRNGRPPGLGRALIRTVLLVIDAFPYVFPLLGVLATTSSPWHRRVGDKLSGTYVIRKPRR